MAERLLADFDPLDLSSAMPWLTAAAKDRCQFNNATPTPTPSDLSTLTLDDIDSRLAEVAKRLAAITPGNLWIVGITEATGDVLGRKTSQNHKPQRVMVWLSGMGIEPNPDELIAQGLPTMGSVARESAKQGMMSVVLSAVGLHSMWMERGDSKLKHPVVPIIEAWLEKQMVVKAFKPSKQASLARFGKSRPEASAPNFAPMPMMPEPEPQGDIHLEKNQMVFPFANDGPAYLSWLLQLYQAAGGEVAARGKGAPWPLRLFVGATMHLHVGHRDGQWHKLVFTTDELIEWLHPRGWSNERRDWKKLPEALLTIRNEVNSVVIGDMNIQIMTVTAIPMTPRAPGAEFMLRIPSSAAKGIALDWPLLCDYGTRNAPLYCAYLSAAAAMDHSASYGHPITAEIGAPILVNGKKQRGKGGSCYATGHAWCRTTKLKGSRGGIRKASSRGWRRLIRRGSITGGERCPRGEHSTLTE